MSLAKIILLVQVQYHAKNLADYIRNKKPLKPNTDNVLSCLLDWLKDDE